MLSQKLINARTANAVRLVSRRCLAVPAKPLDKNMSSRQLIDIDPQNYSIPLRPATMEDTMEPYGSWKTAYEAERRTANKTLAAGIITFAVSMMFFWNSGVVDPLWMPNLDNIMEDTEPFNFDKEGRKTV